MKINLLQLAIIFLTFITLPTSPAHAKKLTFAIVPKYHSVFFDQSGKGCKAAAAQIAEVECLYLGPEKGDVRKQDSIVSQLIDEGIDGIAISVTQSDFLAKSSMQKARQAGIPVITYDSDFDEATRSKYKSIRLAYIGTNNFEFGRTLGEQLKILRPNGGRLLIQTGRPDSPNLNLRIMGLRSALSGKTYLTAPGERLNNEMGWTEARQPILNYDQIQRSVKQLESFLKVQKQQADSFVAVGGWAQDDESNYRKTVKPFKGKLANKEMVLVMSDTSDNQLAMLRDKLAHVNVGQSPYEMGMQSIFTLLKIVKKQKYEQLTYTPLKYCTSENYATCTK